ncbi:hypothetical protein N792_01100 [Lysobacter concretionis Ko07 = DSM 16239]|jgi:hypothetical protein|uniref:Transmembrane protein n=1 Tax=Lysobacter concretionis Ko07 = DSM 16239 TaxID=1122185 RepID=A0A0A0ER10_9GAMM|nr:MULTISPECIES: hypothetical protein [Lysobacter]KGM52864.1 hypothetical protein N792_01100 [Lysobacter concretionis Ko07 = DSM 16239]QOD91305.1 hypothetical protein H2514_01045 [Lysobacter sp. CW239]
MTSTDHLRQDLDYVARAVRRSDRCSGVPAIYFLWAAIIVVGFALPDFAPQLAPLFWLVFGIGGGLASWWLGAREDQRSGTLDRELGRRHGYHWLVGGIGFLVCWLPVLRGAPIELMAGNFLLVAGLVYALAGVHLERPLLWSGLLMLAAFAVLSLFAPPYTWTITGVVIGASLLWAGLASRKTREPAVHP